MSIATFAASNRAQAVPPRTPDVRLRAIEPGDAETAACITYGALRLDPVRPLLSDPTKRRDIT